MLLRKNAICRRVRVANENFIQLVSRETHRFKWSEC